MLLTLICSLFIAHTLAPNLHFPVYFPWGRSRCWYFYIFIHYPYTSSYPQRKSFMCLYPVCVGSPRSLGVGHHTYCLRARVLPRTSLPGERAAGTWNLSYSINPYALCSPDGFSSRRVFSIRLALVFYEFCPIRVAVVNKDSSALHFRHPVDGEGKLSITAWYMRFELPGR